MPKVSFENSDMQIEFIEDDKIKDLYRRSVNA